MAGKGSKPRPYNARKYAENHEKIFGRRGSMKLPAVGEVVDGREYLGNDRWRHHDHLESQLRDENK